MNGSAYCIGSRDGNNKRHAAFQEAQERGRGGKRNECMIDAEYFELPRAKEAGAV